MIWVACLVAGRRAAPRLGESSGPPNASQRRSTGRIAVTAACGLLFVVLPSVEFAAFAVLDAVEGPRLWAPVLAVVSAAPLGTAVVLFRRSASRGDSFGSSLSSAVLGGAATGFLLLLWGLLATAATGM